MILQNILGSSYVQEFSKQKYFPALCRAESNSKTSSELGWKILIFSEKWTCSESVRFI